MLDNITVLHVNTSDCEAEAWLNDIPVARVSSSGYPLDSRPVHEYLLPGTNTLRLEIRPATPAPPVSDDVPGWPPPPKPEGPPVAGARTFATLRLLRGPRGVLPDNPEVQILAALEWRPAAGTPMEPNVVAETSITLPANLPRWLWTDAVPLSDCMETRILEFLRYIAEHMNRQDVTPYLRAARTRFVELGAAYQIGAQAENNFVAQFRRLSAKPGFRMMIPNRDRMALRLCAGGRLIDCIDQDFEPMLRAEKAGPDAPTPIRYPVKIGVLSGQISIIR